MDLLTVKTIRYDEGESLTVYEDTLGHLTVGVSHKVMPTDNLHLRDVITKEHSMTMFLEDPTHEIRLLDPRHYDTIAPTGDQA